MAHSPALKSLLFAIRQHAAFEEFMAAVAEPQLPRFRASQADAADAVKARWIFDSGRVTHHEVWVGFLRGSDRTVDTNGERK